MGRAHLTGGTSAGSAGDDLRRWPSTEAELIALQEHLARAADDAVATDPWHEPEPALVGGCFLAYAPGEAGPGRPGDRAWAAAVVWRAVPVALPVRRDRHLRAARVHDGVRQADDVVAQAVVSGRVPAAYTPGLLAGREGPLLAAAVRALAVRPGVLLVDATGRDHPRRAGLALHLGAVVGIPTVGVTRKPLVASGSPPPLRRGATAPLHAAGEHVGCWVCTRTGARPIVAHAAWRTIPDTAVGVVLHTSSEVARTPVPLQEARRVAREARARGGA